MNRYPRTMTGLAGWLAALVATLSLPALAPIIVFTSAVMAAGLTVAAITREAYLA